MMADGREQSPSHLGGSLMAPIAQPTIAQYLLARLRGFGVKHVFTLPATSCADFIQAVLDDREMENVPACSDLEAGYAADAYARLRGMGAVSVSYGVGTLSLLNAVAGSFVERVPVVVINGGPSAKEVWTERNQGVLFSHSTGLPDSDLNAFRLYTVEAVVVKSPDSAAKGIDRALEACRRHSRPVYIEIPNDLWNKSCRIESTGEVETQKQAIDAEDIEERVEHLARLTIDAICKAKLPAILAGVEVQRFGLIEEFRVLLEVSGLPYATTLLGKSILPEDHPQFVGVYDSNLAPKVTRDLIEQSDALLTLGTILGVDHTPLVQASYGSMILATFEAFRIGYQRYSGVPLQLFIRSLVRYWPPGRRGSDLAKEYRRRLKSGPYQDRRRASLVHVPPASPGSGEDPITHESFFEMIDEFIDEESLVLVDTCLGSFPGADLRITGRSAYIAQPVWLSIGFITGAALGAAFARNFPRTIAVIGDGGFQTGPQGFSSLVRAGRPVVLFVLNNGLYGIEQWLIKPSYFFGQDPALDFNVLNRWNYAELAQAMGGKGYEVRTNDELAAVLNELKAGLRGAVLVDVLIPSRDLPPENR